MNSFLSGKLNVIHLWQLKPEKTTFNFKTNFNENQMKQQLSPT